jgi:endonuclease/exonuclease/phosphatase family metal-dependent hydrolase
MGYQKKRFSCWTFAFAICFTFLINENTHAIVIPSDQKTMATWSKSPPIESLPRRFRFLNWNLQKGEGHETWLRDMNMLTGSFDIAAFQEAVDGGWVGSYFASLQFKTSIMARSFVFDFGEHVDQGTGVALVSKFRASNITALRSRVFEPFLHSPKMILAGRYQFQDGGDLWMVTIHAINFVDQRDYENQIDQLEEFLRGLSGSIIVAGDFNTWNLWRDEKIDQVFARLGFAHLSPDNEHRNLVLDHVFVKGCQAHDFIVRDDISSSDHWPLQLNFDCSKSQESLLAKSAH